MLCRGPQRARAGIQVTERQCFERLNIMGCSSANA